MIFHLQYYLSSEAIYSLRVESLHGVLEYIRTIKYKKTKFISIITGTTTEFRNIDPQKYE